MGMGDVLAQGWGGRRLGDMGMWWHWNRGHEDVAARGHIGCGGRGMKTWGQAYGHTVMVAQGWEMW